MLKPLLFNKRTVVGLFLLISLVVAGFTSCNTADKPLTVNEIASLDVHKASRISLEALKEKIDSNSNLVIVDTRSLNEYNYSHIPGAVSIPLIDTEASISELSGFEEVVTYCT